MSNGTALPRKGVIVSGGAPTLHLGAGALCAFKERGVNFDVIATSGAGALPGLLYMKPNKVDPATALRNVVNMNVHDAIYDLIPSNYKVFFKYGPFAQIFYQIGQAFPHHYETPWQRLISDGIDLVTAAITPTTLTYRSKAVLSRVQVVNDLVDWPGLSSAPQDFFLNAFNLTTQKLEVFDKQTMTPDAFYAALAMPWLYPPTPRVPNGPLYTEGASHDPSGIEAVLMNDSPDKLAGVEWIALLDTIGPDVWTDPGSLYEALELAIMDPIVALAETVAALYAVQEVYFNEFAVPRIPLPKLYRLPFQLPDWERGKLLEWSYSNAVTLWNAGYDAVQPFLPNPSQTEPAQQYRYYNTLALESREDAFLRLFGDPLRNLPQTV